MSEVPEHTVAGDGVVPVDRRRRRQALHEPDQVATGNQVRQQGDEQQHGQAQRSLGARMDLEPGASRFYLSLPGFHLPRATAGMKLSRPGGGNGTVRSCSALM